jgi:hypothetical protein
MVCRHRVDSVFTLTGRWSKVGENVASIRGGTHRPPKGNLAGSDRVSIADLAVSPGPEPEAQFQSEFKNDLLGGVVVLRHTG